MDNPSPFPSTVLKPLLANIRDYWLGWGAQHRETEPTALFRSGVGFPLFNGVRQSNAGDDWSRIAGQFDGVPWMWWLGEDSPAGLAADLVTRGAVEAGELPVWTTDIVTVPTAEPLEGFVVQQPTTPGDIDRWVRMWVPASDLPADLAPHLSALEQARPPTPGQEYVRLAGWLDGELVASAVVLVAHGVAGIYVVSTEPSYRRRGIGWAITQAALDIGTEHGCRVAVLNPTEQGAPLYHRMGFEPVSTYRILVPAQP